ncbi:MAG: HEAT repeat domain-containing protein [Promethearchaeota archaeon]
MANNQNNSFNMAIKNLFHGESWEQRAEAATELGKLKEARATNLLTKALKSEKDPVVINRIIEAMGKIKDPKATMIIIDFLKQELELPEERQNKKRLFVIIESLMKIGDKRALEHLGVLLNSCESDIRSLTENAFECIDINWRNNIKKYYKNIDKNI